MARHIWTPTQYSRKTSITHTPENSPEMGNVRFGDARRNESQAEDIKWRRNVNNQCGARAGNNSMVGVENGRGTGEMGEGERGGKIAELPWFEYGG